jgi:ferritin-like metal-binding protein YciE
VVVGAFSSGSISHILTAGSRTVTNRPLFNAAKGSVLNYATGGSLANPGRQTQTQDRGTHSMKLNSLRDLYVMELKDLYNGEQQILKALPKMAEQANSPELRSAFEDHLEETRIQVQRLEQIFQKLDEAPKGQKCKGLEGIIDEGEDAVDEDAPPAVCDAALISSAQKVEHYEIASYGAVRTFARRLGFEDHAQLLTETLQEEGNADKKLTSLAESYINEEAKTAR